MSEKNNTPAPVEETTPQPDVKTFTQDEVNRIVSDRLNEDRQKREQAPKPDPLAEREQALAKREYEFTLKEELTARKLPHALLEAVHAPDLDTFKKSLDILKEHSWTFNPNPNRLLDMPPAGNMPSDKEGFNIRQAMGLKL